MMTDEERIWRLACERVDCKIEDQVELCYVYPPLNDPRAAMAMLEWLGKNDPMALGFDIHYWPERDKNNPWNISFAGKASSVGATLSLALAAAVCALPKEA